MEGGKEGGKEGGIPVGLHIEGGSYSPTTAERVSRGAQARAASAAQAALPPLRIPSSAVVGSPRMGDMAELEA